MPLEEAVKYVAAAYAIIWVAVAVYVVFVARRVTVLEREVRLMNELLDKGEGAAR
ncbi:MAG TPA: CcmD family protein [Thermoleophilia bacterium]|nr:CcmD family protein [Thermoleophilia bacterium]